MRKIFFIFSVFYFLVSCQDSQNNQPAEKQSGTIDIKTQKEEKKSNLKKTLQWSAYKTNEKISVTGTFNKISLFNTNETEDLKEALKGAKFTCIGTTVSTYDAARDGTLKTFFFKRLSSDEITGSFGSFENNKVIITLTLDGQTATKEFDYKEENNSILITGSIDILKDFKAEKAFNSLHKACFDLHEGKTWSEVDIKVKVFR